MSVIMGSGDFTYRVEEGWGKLPEGWEYIDAAAVGIDRRDQVYVFNRGEHPMVVFNREGNFLRSWGEGIFTNPHGVHMAPDDTIFCTDNGDHTVRQCTLDGKVLLTIGVPGKAAPFMSGEPFCRCTHTALTPKGDILISDGYGNARIHKYSPNGKPIGGWGRPGSDPGEFNLPHNILCDEDGWVYVADRENNRVQVFDSDGRYETQWNNMHRPCGLCMAGGCSKICYVGEVGPYNNSTRGSPNLGPRLCIYTNKGELITRIHREPAAGTEPGQLLSPHGLAVDSRGDLYIGEVAETAWRMLFPGKPPPRPLRALQKWVKVPAGTVA